MIMGIIDWKALASWYSYQTLILREFTVCIKWFWWLHPLFIGGGEDTNWVSDGTEEQGQAEDAEGGGVHYQCDWWSFWKAEGTAEFLFH